MLHTGTGTTTDPAVNNALDIVETDLKAAIITAAERLNAVLDGKPSDTRVLHGHLSDLHRMSAQIDQNLAARERSRTRR